MPTTAESGIAAEYGKSTLIASPGSINSKNVPRAGLQFRATAALSMPRPRSYSSGPCPRHSAGGLLAILAGVAVPLFAPRRLACAAALADGTRISHQRSAYRAQAQAGVQLCPRSLASTQSHGDPRTRQSQASAPPPPACRVPHDARRPSRTSTAASCLAPPAPRIASPAIAIATATASTHGPLQADGLALVFEIPQGDFAKVPEHAETHLVHLS
ncbi:hypothetical protein DFH27DRAFT_617108 [Peziza echinospora]|nr:hypothetical protein DFH27DRAFT_617108 [Peziza echinospora]